MEDELLDELLAEDLKLNNTSATATPKTSHIVFDFMVPNVAERIHFSLCTGMQIQSRQLIQGPRQTIALFLSLQVYSNCNSYKKR
jgi:hypothetical protein